MRRRVTAANDSGRLIHLHPSSGALVRHGRRPGRLPRCISRRRGVDAASVVASKGHPRNGLHPPRSRQTTTVDGTRHCRHRVHVWCCSRGDDIEPRCSRVAMHVPRSRHSRGPAHHLQAPTYTHIRIGTGTGTSIGTATTLQHGRPCSGTPATHRTRENHFHLGPSSLQPWPCQWDPSRGPCSFGKDADGSTVELLPRPGSWRWIAVVAVWIAG